MYNLEIQIPHDSVFRLRSDSNKLSVHPVGMCLKFAHVLVRSREDGDEMRNEPHVWKSALHEPGT